MRTEMEDRQAAILALVQTILEEHKTTNGKRFSTYYEGHAHIAVEFELGMNEAKMVAQGIDFLWEKLKAEDFNGEYGNALKTMHLHGMMAVESLLSTLAMVEKLQGGVVHEPK